MFRLDRFWPNADVSTRCDFCLLLSDKPTTRQRHVKVYS